MRISPKLPGCREVVRWHAGHDRRFTMAIEPELTLVCPDVGAVVRDEDRNVPNDADSFIIGMLLQRCPLHAEHELHKRVVVDFGAQLVSPALDRALVTKCDVSIPFRPPRVVEL